MRRFGGRSGRLLLGLFLLVIMAACASPPRANLMAPEMQQALASKEGSPLRRAIALASVGGGEKTDPLWYPEVGSEEFEVALRHALDAHGYLSPDPATAAYHLEAFIVEIKKPTSGYTSTVHSFVRYKLVGAADGSALFDEVIHGEYTATVGDAFVGLQRLRLAEEGAMRASISALLGRLHSL